MPEIMGVIWQSNFIISCTVPVCMCVIYSNIYCKYILHYVLPVIVYVIDCVILSR